MVTRTTLSRDETAAAPVASRRRRDDPSRLATYAVLAVAAGALPLPWVPDVLLRGVRGALAHDIAARHGVSLTPEARSLLAEPASSGARRGVAGQALRFVGARYVARLLSRFGPLAFAWPARDAARVYLLGRLFERYLDRARRDRSVRVDDQEARRVRSAIDRAVLRAITIDAPPVEEPTAVDDQRDAATAVIDALLALAAEIPGRLARRLDAAFDELIESVDG